MPGAVQLVPVGQVFKPHIRVRHSNKGIQVPVRLLGLTNQFNDFVCLALQLGIRFAH